MYPKDYGLHEKCVNLTHARMLDTRLYYPPPHYREPGYEATMAAEVVPPTVNCYYCCMGIQVPIDTVSGEIVMINYAYHTHIYHFVLLK